jgi:hypothetical protein
MIPIISLFFFDWIRQSFACGHRIVEDERIVPLYIGLDKFPFSMDNFQKNHSYKNGTGLVNLWNVQESGTHRLEGSSREVD